MASPMNVTVLLRMDNVTVVSYINQKGASPLPIGNSNLDMVHREGNHTPSRHQLNTQANKESRTVATGC